MPSTNSNSQLDQTLQMAPNNWKPVREKHEQKIFLYQVKKIKRLDEENELQKLMFSTVGRSENEIQKLMFSRLGRSAPRIGEAARENCKYIRLPMFLSQMKKIKRQDEENENELHRLMYSRVGR